MKVTLENNIIKISNPSKEFERYLSNLLSYKDKSKMYQVKRMSKNAFLRNTEQYKQLKQEINGSLLDRSDNGDLLIPSGFAFILNGLHDDGTIEIVDHRCDTGRQVSFPWYKKPFDLRDYQREAVDVIKSNYKGIINFATGLGKTLVAVHAVREVGKKSLIVVPSESIAKQFYNDLTDAYGSHRVGYFGGGKKKINDVTVGIAASVNNHIDMFNNADLGLVIFDETHHTPANTFFNIAMKLSSVGKMFGLTATAYRSDGKDIFINAGCGDILLERDIKWGIANKWLAQPYFMIREVETGGKSFKDNKLKNYKEHVLNNKIMKEQIRSDAEKFINAGKSVLILVDEVAHGKELASQLNIPFATGIDKQSQSYVDAMNKGTISGLVGTSGKLGEGTDIKRIDVLVLADFTASRGPVIQMIGRGLRPFPGKKACIILDYVPKGSEMLSRHAYQRIEYYKDITDNVKMI